MPSQIEKKNSMIQKTIGLQEKQLDEKPIN